MSTCTGCGAADQPEGARFCFSCGTPLAAPSCGSCGAGLVPGARFCSECGAVQEETRELLSRYFDECRQIIARYGGTVEKFIGPGWCEIEDQQVARADPVTRFEDALRPARR